MFGLTRKEQRERERERERTAKDRGYSFLDEECIKSVVV